MVDGVIGQIEKELIENYKVKKEINVIATGGFSELISSESKYINIIEPDLMLEGLKLIYDRIKE